MNKLLLTPHSILIIGYDAKIMIGAKKKGMFETRYKWLLDACTFSFWYTLCVMWNVIRAPYRRSTCNKYNCSVKSNFEEILLRKKKKKMKYFWQNSGNRNIANIC